MKALIQWFRRKQIDRAQALLESYGLSVVKIITVAGTQYLVDADGAHRKLASPVKGGKR